MSIKKFTLIQNTVPVLSLTASLLLTGCGSGEDKTKGETSRVVKLRQDTVVVKQKTRYILTSRGIGPIEVGMDIDSWPENSDGLYEYVEADRGGDANQFNFMGDDEPSVTVLDFGEGKADLLIVDDPAIGAQVGDTVVDMNTPFATLLRMPDVEATWEQLDDEGMWYWKCSGLWFAPAMDKVPDKLASKLYDSQRAPQAQDFPDEVTIGYIATGLPF